MTSYEGHNPFSGTSYVDADVFCEIVRCYGDNYSTHDPWQPCFYQRPTDFGEIAMLIRCDEEQLRKWRKEKFAICEANKSVFLEWLNWLRANPSVWIEGYR